MKAIRDLLRPIRRMAGDANTRAGAGAWRNATQDTYSYIRAALNQANLAMERMEEEVINKKEEEKNA